MANSTANSGAQHLLTTMLETGKYSDLTIKCGSETFHVHKNVVCLQSKPLAAMVNGNFLEARDSMIDLVEDDPRTVNRFIRFLYSGDYDDNQPTERLRSTGSSITGYCIITGNYPYLRTTQEIQRSLPVPDDEIVSCIRCDIPTGAPWSFEIVMRSEESGNKVLNYLKGFLDEGRPIWAILKGGKSTQTPGNKYVPSPKALEINTLVYITADKYDVPALKLHAIQKAEKSIAYAWDNAYFTSCLKLLYENTVQSDRALKDVFIRAAYAHKSALLDDPQFVDLLTEMGEIGLDLFMRN